MPANGLGHIVNKTTLISFEHWRLLQTPILMQRNQLFSTARASQTKEPFTRIKISRPAEDWADPVQRILRAPPKSPFKRLILETPLWQHAMSSSLKSALEGLKPSECEKGKSVGWPPIPYVPPLDLIKKQETEQIKVQMPDGTNFQMAAFAYGTNEDYLIHVIAVLRNIKQKGVASKIKVA